MHDLHERPEHPGSNGGVVEERVTGAVLRNV